MYQRAQEQSAAGQTDGSAANGAHGGAEDVVDAEVVDEGK
jgi:hypothetical protein